MPCFVEVYVRRGGPGCDKLLDEVRQRIPGALQDLFTRNVENFLIWSWESEQFWMFAGTNWCLQPRGHCNCNLLKGIGDFWKSRCRLVTSKSHFRKITAGMRECLFNILPGSPLAKNEKCIVNSTWGLTKGDWTCGGRRHSVLSPFAG